MNRKTDGKFPPGVSGNPAGRPKGAIAELRDIAQSHRDVALGALLDIAQSKRAPAAARVSAACALLDRGFGKPIALVAETDSKGEDKPEMSRFEQNRRLLFVLTQVFGQLELGPPQAEALRKFLHDDQHDSLQGKET